jgi:maltose O-acetyltransferase
MFRFIFKLILKIVGTKNNTMKFIRIYYLKTLGIKIGNNVHISPKAYIDLHRPKYIEIGNNVKITRWAMILCYDSSKDFIGLHNEAYKKVKIGNDVYIGAKSTIMPGVTIGNNVIIGANSVVTRDISSNCIVIGSPAKEIKKLTR